MKQYPPEELYLTYTICKRNHVDQNGYSVRRRKTGCIACAGHLPEGMFTHEYTDLRLIDKRRKYNTWEERHKARSEASMRWTKKNPDKFKEYTTKYNNKPERKEVVSEKRKEQYQENKEKFNARVRKRSAYLKEHEPEVWAERQKRYYKHTKERMANRTLEQIERDNERNRRYYYRKKAEKKQAVEFLIRRQNETTEVG